MANPNIVSTTSILGKTDAIVVPASLGTLTINPSGSGLVYKVNLISVANVNGTTHLDVAAALRRGGNDYYIAYVVAVPADGSLVLVGRENPIYLNEGDSIVIAGQAVVGASTSDLHAICSYEIISDS